jgi:beta-propeller repeat-containing protein
VDTSGNAYVIGFTTSTNFPTANPLQPTNHGAGDAFVAKLNPSGSALVYSTYLGGTAIDYGRSIAIDGRGNAYVTGYTASVNFPTANPLQPGNHGGPSWCPCDGFVAKLKPNGSALIYSTYLGGSSDDGPHGVAVDGFGNAYVTGETYSTDFPTVNPIQPALHGNQDVFVFKLNASGSALVYSTYLGGKQADFGYDIAVDGSGNAYVTGFTASADFPTANPLQPKIRGGQDAFVAKLNAAGSALVYSTYLGGTNNDEGVGIRADRSGNAYVTGYTLSTDFPTANALQVTNHGGADAFVAELNAHGSALTYSTYFGGSSNDYGRRITVDSSGNVYWTGRTLSFDLPTASPLQATNHGLYDAFVVKSAPTSGP